MLRWDWLWRVSWQGLEGLGQEEAFQFSPLLALPSESESSLGGDSGGPRHSATTGVVTRDVLGRIEDVGHETGRFDADGPAELHALLETPKNRWGEDVLGTLLPGGEGTTGLDLLTENESNEDVQTADREEEEGGDEGEAVDTMGKNCRPN